MKIDNSMFYSPCPCGSGTNFKFCCWPKVRDLLDRDMTKAEVIQTIRCTAAGVDYQSYDSKAADICEQGRELLMDGDFKNAMPLFTVARTLEPTLMAAWNNEACCAWERDNVEEAYELSKQGIEASPVRNTFGVAAMAIFSHTLGRDEEASEWLERALADKFPFSRDIVVEVCKALALFRRHRDIAEYATASGMDEDEQIAFFKGTALANLGDFSKAAAALEIAGSGLFGPIADRYLDLIDNKCSPDSVYEGDWPYFVRRSFAPARWFEEALENGKDPFGRYPHVAVDAIEVLVSDKVRDPAEMLKLLEGRTGERIGKLRDALEKRVEREAKRLKKGNLPEGVVEEKDDARFPILRPIPRWRMKYELLEDGDSEDDADAIIEGFVRPYFNRYCSFAAESEEAEIAVLRLFCDKNKPASDCPVVKLGAYEQLWDILYEELTDFFDNAAYSSLSCIVRYDQMYGGPVLIMEDEKGDVEIFSVAIPDRFGED